MHAPAHPLFTLAMSPLPSLHWGVIGCGDVCVRKSGPALSQARSSIHAVARRTPGAAAAYAAAHGIPAAYEDAAGLLADPAVNVVYVATPPDGHAGLGVAAAAAGKPALLEKPLARCAAEAAGVAGAFERAGVPLFVAFYRRCLPRYVRVRELLPRVGEVTGVRVDVCVPRAGGKFDQGMAGGGLLSNGWRFQKGVAGGGLFVDIGSHVVDLLDFLLGPVTVECSEFGDARASSWDAAAAESYSGVEDHLFAALSFQLAPAAGAANLLYFDFAVRAGEAADRVVISGTEAELSFPALGLFESPANIVLADPRTGAVELDEVVPNPEFLYAPLIESIVHELVDGELGACPCTAACGVRAAVAVDAALEWGKSPAALRQKGFCRNGGAKAEAAVRKAIEASGRRVVK
jgi:1,5-anhydro-D-fructose reductase (1,5-anhydro-D-mannitol-forming)